MSFYLVNDFPQVDRYLFDCLSIERQRQEASVTALHSSLDYALSSQPRVSYPYDFPYINNTKTTYRHRIGEGQPRIILLASELFSGSEKLDGDAMEILQKTLLRTSKVQSTLAGRR